MLLFGSVCLGVRMYIYVTPSIWAGGGQCCLEWSLLSVSTEDGYRGRWHRGGNVTPPQPVNVAFSELSDSLLEDLIAAHLVLPNRVTVPVKKGLDVTNLRVPLPCVSTRSLLQSLRPGWRDAGQGRVLNSAH